MYMKIIIYPGSNELNELNVNKKMFSKPLFNYNFIFIKDTNISSLEEMFKENINKIKSIIILIDDGGKFISNNISFILKNKNINFFIHENDIHYNKKKPEMFERYKKLRDNLINNDHIFILSCYWYYYKKVYNINPNNLICFPKFVFTENILQVNDNPIMKVLLSGSMNGNYPMRRYLKNLNNPNVDILKHTSNIYGDDYIKYLSNYICAFTCCACVYTPYIINKFFEIPAAGCLLLAYDEYVKNELKELGFIDNVNYISCNQKNVNDKIEYICNSDNYEIINKIRINGFYFVKNNHTIENRYKLLEKITE